jgi:sugar lactone lactonase YvrE
MEAVCPSAHQSFSMKKLTSRFPFAILGLTGFFFLLTLSCSKNGDVYGRFNVTPEADTIGATVTITGSNFDPTNTRDTVMFNAPAGYYLYNTNVKIISASSSQLTVIVPPNALTGLVKVKVGNIVYSTITDFTVVPNFSPITEAAGYSINITGSGFSTDLAGNQVKFNGMSATVTAALNWKLTVTVPHGVTKGPISVTTNGKTVTSLIDFAPAPIATVTTLAGSGTAGSTDDVGLAASFNQPMGLCTDNKNNLYVADLGNNKIRIVTPDGKVSTLAGNGNAPDADGTYLSASIYAPSSVAINGDTSSMYVSESLGNRIRYLHNGNVTTLSNNNTIPYTIYFEPYGLSIDNSGNIFFVNWGYGNVTEITASQQVKLLAATSSPIAGYSTNNIVSMYIPQGTSLDNQGNLYVANTGSFNILKITPSGNVSVFAGGGNTVGDGPANSVVLDHPTSLAFDANGNMYVVESGVNQIRRITPDGYITTVAGSSNNGSSQDGTGASAGFNNPFGIAIDANGVIYVSEAGGNKIRKLVVQ